MLKSQLGTSFFCSQVEIIKEKSDYLRHPLMSELVTQDPFISEDAVQLMKFHGSYQQDHREKRAFGQGKFYQFMMRTRQPSGLVTNQLYLVMDDLADQVNCGSWCRHQSIEIWLPVAGRGVIRDVNQLVITATA
eukprot:GHUV01033912.1.p2 GENE.GHUV01033912.1~~GHUV01033912.1.p2  ORF type:complete len:134 (-),score=26.22 GHUV01033912.1:386-787(-)